MVDVERGAIPPLKATDRAPASRSWFSIAATTAFIVVVIGLSVRAALLMNVPGEPNYHQWVMQDFRDGTYYPVVSFLHGGNPYNAAQYLESYPVRQTFSPYSPLYLLVHSPFGLFPHGLAQWLFYALTVGLTIGLGYTVLRLCARQPSASAVLGLAAVTLASRPGHWNLLLGQPTLVFVLAVYVALFCGSSVPLVAGTALAAATMKPTFGVPLAVLMLAQRSYRSVGIGLAIGAIVTLAPAAVLVRSAGGLVPLLESAWSSYLSFGQSAADSPLLCPTRIDAAAIVSRVLGIAVGPVVENSIFVLLIGLAAATVRRVRTIGSGRGSDLYCVAVASVAILITTYHQGYCALLLVLPLTALVLDCWAPVEIAVSYWVRYVLLVLLSLPAVNYLASFTVSSYLDSSGGVWRVIMSLNGGALLVALVIYVYLVFRAEPAGIDVQRIRED